MGRKDLAVIGLLAAIGTACSGQYASADDRLNASNCFQCHGTNGTNGGFDALAGDPALDTFNKLKDMQTKSAGGNVMYPHARGYTDAELMGIATYFSKLPKP